MNADRMTSDLKFRETDWPGYRVVSTTYWQQLSDLPYVRWKPWWWWWWRRTFPFSDGRPRRGRRHHSSTHGDGALLGLCRKKHMHTIGHSGCKLAATFWFAPALLCSALLVLWSASHPSRRPNFVHGVRVSSCRETCVRRAAPGGRRATAPHAHSLLYGYTKTNKYERKLNENGR